MSAAMQLHPEPHRKKVPWRTPEDLPEKLREDLTSKAPVSAVARRWGLNLKTASRWRRRVVAHAGTSEKATLARWKSVEDLPAAFRADLASLAPLSHLAEKWGMSARSILDWRKRVCPAHPNRPGRPKKAVQEARALAVLHAPEADELTPVRVPTRALGQGLTPRQQEVLAREVTPYLIVELLREKPLGACIICWRDMSTGRGGETLACSRTRPGSKTQVCQVFMNTMLRCAQRAQERAKQSLLVEGGAW